ITTNSNYKLINLILRYINVTYLFNIKNYKNSTYNIYFTFHRLSLNNNILTTFYKSIKLSLR
ncbi:hypothetical protein QBC41DRAFT_237989, partial [Cercophora samala]